MNDLLFVKIIDLENTYATLLHSYVYFNMSRCTNNINFNLKYVLSNFGLYTDNRKTRKNHIKGFKDVLEVFISNGIYEVCSDSKVTYDKISTCKSNEDITIHFNEKVYNKHSEKFTTITYKEYSGINSYIKKKISMGERRKSDQNALKLFEVFISFKKLMFKNRNSDYCYYTKQHLIDELGYGGSVIDSIISSLVESELLWIYPIEEYKKRFNIKDKYTYIASLHRLGIEKIVCAVGVLG